MLSTSLNSLALLAVALPPSAVQAEAPLKALATSTTPATQGLVARSLLDHSQRHGPVRLLPILRIPSATSTETLSTRIRSTSITPAIQRLPPSDVLPAMLIITGVPQGRARSLSHLVARPLLAPGSPLPAPEVSAS